MPERMLKSKQKSRAGSRSDTTVFYHRWLGQPLSSSYISASKSRLEMLISVTAYHPLFVSFLTVYDGMNKKCAGFWLTAHLFLSTILLAYAPVAQLRGAAVF
ncbi:MAG: hypothetical protein IJY91_07740 [Oscillospiraceae bacterium]|nr:hypothetical protein [Oscillospiraceae bacterium]